MTLMDHPEARRLDLALPDGRTLHAAQGGEGRDVVLIHGALSVLEDMLLGPYPALARRFRVTAFDRPGHGRSERRRLDASIWRQAEALREGAARLGLERPLVVGHSFGGAVAMAWGLSFPEEVSGLLLLAPIAFPELRAEHLLFGPRAVPVFGDVLAQTGGRLFDAVFSPVLVRLLFAPQSVPARFRAGFPFRLVTEPRCVQADGEDAMEALAGLSAAAFRYPACRTPVRVLAGDADRVVNNRLHGQMLAAAVRDGRFRALPGLGHMLHHFAQDEIVAEAEALLAPAAPAAQPADT